MAKKKQEIALMREIESQEEWEDVMGKEGLWVVDVYQEWSGSCDAMVSNFRRIKNELGDDLLHFAMAKADTIESLEKYRGSCEPCFLYFAAGVLVSFVHGANAPLILRTLTEQLTQEHKVLDGNSERKEVKDPFVANREAADDGQRDEEDEDEDGVEQGYTVAIIKPNVVADGKVDDILAEMTARGIDVITQEQRQLTEEEAREFYSHLKDEDYFEDLVNFMTSGPSHVLVLTKGQEDDSIIKDWRDMLGPPTVEDAKENAPESLRARYGQAGLMNALHGSDSKETAARELAFFFPQMNVPMIQKKKKEVQRTLALIRPDAFAKHRDAILERIKEAGFQIALHKEVSLTKEQAAEFYNEHAGQPYFEEIIERMSSGPLLALGLAREDAVENWRGMLGPTIVEQAKNEAPDSLRAQFAVDDISINQLHGSDSIETAKKELNFFFPVEQTVAMIKPDGMGTKDAIIEKIHEAGFRIAARKETVITREIAEGFYADQKDKEYFNDLVEHMMSGPTAFLVLSREGAVEGWRETIGPTDPTQAKEQAPDSLRAQFGTDILKNAVHGASSAQEAQQKIEAVFGPLEFNEDGEPPQEAEEQAVSGSPVPQVSDVAPEYRQQAEQQQQEEQQQEAAAQEQGAEQEAEAKPQEQEEQQAEQPAEAEGQAEGEVQQSEEKPAEAEGGEATEQTQSGEVEEKDGQVEEKPSETPAESAEKAESPEKTEGEVEEKPAEAAAESAAESAEKEEDAGQATQQKATEEQETPTPSQETKPEDSTPEQAAAAADKPEAETAAAAADKPEAETAAAAAEQAEAKTEEEQKDTPAAEEPKDAKAEEQQKDETEGQKEEEGKGEQKADTAAETKKEGEEEKKEA